MQTPAKTPIPSQCDRILALLKEGKSLTTYELHLMGIQSPTTRVTELRRAGFPIICTMENHINQFGQTVKRGRYSLATSQNTP